MSGVGAWLITRVLQLLIPRKSTTVSLRYWKWHRATLLQVGKYRKRKVSNGADCLWEGALWGYWHCHVPSGGPKCPRACPWRRQLCLSLLFYLLDCYVPLRSLRLVVLHDYFWVQDWRSVTPSCLCLEIFHQERLSLFPGCRLMAGGWQYCTAKVQLPVSLTLQATYQYLPVPELYSSESGGKSPLPEWFIVMVKGHLLVWARSWTCMGSWPYRWPIGISLGRPCWVTSTHHKGLGKSSGFFTSIVWHSLSQEPQLNCSKSLFTFHFCSVLGVQARLVKM